MRLYPLSRTIRNSSKSSLAAGSVQLEALLASIDTLADVKLAPGRSGFRVSPARPPASSCTSKWSLIVSLRSLNSPAGKTSSRTLNCGGAAAVQPQIRAAEPIEGTGFGFRIRTELSLKSRNTSRCAACYFPILEFWIFGFSLRSGSGSARKGRADVTIERSAAIELLEEFECDEESRIYFRASLSLANNWLSSPKRF